MPVQTLICDALEASECAQCCLLLWADSVDAGSCPYADRDNDDCEDRADWNAPATGLAVAG